uniref:Uncharacterized protein n=1 Tax=Haemonchus contortus TaxID=6289 RepID=A0A7I5E7L2_HAECO
MDQYNEVYRDQLKQGIVELAGDNDSREASQVRYILHQPVLTLQKEITKLRIFFDASAHYKSSPSLNDVLHRGPAILPVSTIWPPASYADWSYSLYV